MITHALPLVSDDYIPDVILVGCARGVQVRRLPLLLQQEIISMLAWRLRSGLGEMQRLIVDPHRRWSSQV
jgi:hypothetical protein